LREWPEAPVQKNLAGIVQRLQSVRAIGVEPDRERRIHRARYTDAALTMFDKMIRQWPSACPPHSVN
jgi:hypothetical protein